MAYGSWSASQWRQIWSNGYYKAEVQWRYRIDPVGNKAEYAVQQIRITSLNQYYSFYNDGAEAGIATITSQRTTQTVNARVNALSSQTFNLTDKSREVSAQSNGVFGSDINVHGYFKANVGGANHAPEFGWAVSDISSLLPSIDRSGGTGTITAVTRGYNYLTVTYSSNVPTSLVEYSLNNQDWYNAGISLPSGGSASFTIGGLTPNTSYTVYVRHRRDYNYVYSSPATVNTSTTLPAAPTKGSVSISGITYKSFNVQLSGFSFGAGATWGYYRYRVNGGSWINVGQNTNFSVTSLSPNTIYTVEAQLIDNYGSGSGVASAKAQTSLPPVPSAGNITVGEITPFTIAISYDGFTAGELASISRYEVACYSSGSPSYISNGLNKSYVFSNLNPETTYNIVVRAVDNYGQTASARAQAMTLQDQVKPYIKTNGVWKQGRLYYKQNGSWVKVKKAYIKENGAWRINE